MLRAIFHVDDYSLWPMVLKNVRNFLAAEPDSTIEVLANASAVVFYVIHQKALGDAWQELAARGVTFKACRNAMNEHQMSEATLPASVVAVSSGVVELARMQAEGYACIRP